MDKSKYNSHALKEEFKEFYKDFFSSCATIISAPVSFGWGSNYPALFGSLSVRQNLPLRVYVGLEETIGGKVEFNRVSYFVPSKRKFVESEIPQPFCNDVLNFLEKEICKIITPSDFRGLKISIISEMQINSGLDPSGTLSSALSSAIFLHYGKVDPKKLKEFSEAESKKTIADPIFDSIFRFAWKIQTCFHGPTCGSSVFSSFFSSLAPIIYFYNPENKYFYNDNDFINNFTLNIDRFHYKGFRLNEIEETADGFSFPFDFGLINTGPGKLKRLSNVNFPQEMRDNLKETGNFFKTFLSTYFDNNNFKTKPLFSDVFENRPVEHVWDSYLLLLSTATLNIVRALNDLSKKGVSFAEVYFLFKNLNNFQSMLKALGTTSPAIDDFCGYLKQCLNKINDEFGIGIQQTETDKGGYLVFAIASPRLRDHIYDMVQEYNIKNNDNMSVDWVSWRDGLESSGLIVEQSIVNEIYSDLISRGALQIIHLDHNNLHEDIYTVEEFEKSKKNMDVLIDSINEEIVVRGQKLTSKELRTIKHTIEVLRVVLENVGIKIDKDKLPHSGYTKDRNEFQSKIVSPFVKALENVLNRQIRFNIEGSITQFTVTFEPKNIEFYYIEKEF